MKIVLNIFIILICMILIISCKKEVSFNIPIKYYNIDLIEDYTQVTYLSSKQETRRKEYVCTITNWAVYDGKYRFMYSWNSINHFIKGSDLEIVFVRDKNGGECLLRPENCLIGAKLIDKKLKAFFILWRNKCKKEKPQNITKKIVIKTCSSSSPPYFNWEINENTESIISNLDIQIIKNLYPKFKGVYKKLKLDSININYDYSFITLDFFNKIKFSNYKLGKIRDKDGRLFPRGEGDYFD